MERQNPEQHKTGTLSGNLLRLGERREIAIYLRGGTAWVAEFKKGHGEVYNPSAWFSLYGRALVHAQRRGEVNIISPIPGDVVARIERLHLRMEKQNLAPVIRRALAALVGELRGRLVTEGRPTWKATHPTSRSTCKG